MTESNHTRCPNILLIMTDQQRWDTISALGNPIIKTPALDRLVREGATFSHCYTPAPVCVPARCSLITGQPPHLTGCFDNVPMPFHLPSVMERLSGLGYQTHGVGKMHFMPDTPRLWGFESRDVSEDIPGAGDDYQRYLAENGFGHVDEPHGLRSEMYYIPQPSQVPAHLHHTAWLADRALDFFRRRDRQRPFFLWASFIKPHPPFEAPAPWHKLYRAAEMPAPFRPEGYESLLTLWNRVQNRYKYRDHGYDELLVRAIRAMYYASISFLDYHIGRILDGLGREAANTLVVFTSDHGELLGDYGSFGKRCMLNAAARVPLLVRWPGVLAAGQRCEAPASLLDLWPTFLAAARAPESPGSREGVDLVELAQGRSSREFVYSQFSRLNKGLYMATSRSLKYIYSAADNREWLFDLNIDPHETHNRANNPMYMDRLREMRARLLQRFIDDGYTEPVDGNHWQQYAPPVFPADGDAGLLFQDPANLEERLAGLGRYSRPVSVPGRDAMSWLTDETIVFPPEK